MLGCVTFLLYGCLITTRRVIHFQEEIRMTGMHISFSVTALAHLCPGTNINILVFHFCSLENVSPYKDIAFSLEKDKKNLADTPNYLIIASFIAKNSHKPPLRGVACFAPRRGCYCQRLNDAGFLFVQAIVD
jgi:hypothetical protein